VNRRGFLRGLLAAAGAAPALALTATVCAAQAAPAGGGTTVTPWGKDWTTLQGSGGLQVRVTTANGSTVGVPVTWTADGRVTAAHTLPLTVTAPAHAGVQHVTGAAGFGIAVRRAA
jgi:anaerobic selenocysteine-containing dehydrogenase